MGNSARTMLRPSAEEREAYGFIAMSVSRGPIIIYTTLFASLAINAFSLSVSDCQGLVLGGSVKASSVLATLGALEGVANALAAPLIGAFADLTPHRKSGLIAGTGVMILTVVAMGVLFSSSPSDKENPDPLTKHDDPFLPVAAWNDDAAIVVLVLFLFAQVLCYEFVSVLTMTYSAELSPDPAKTTHYLAKSFGLFNAMQLAVVVLVTALSIALHLNGFEQGQVGAFVAVGASLLWLVPGALWIGDRKETEADLDKRCCGMRHVGTALGDMWRLYPELLKLMVAWMFAASAMSSMITLSTTYLQFYLGFSNRTTSLLLALALLAAVPGAFLAEPLKRWLGLKNAFAAVNLAYGVSYTLAPFLLVSEPSTTPRDSKLSIYGRCDNATLALAGSAAESLVAGLGPRVAPKYVLYLSGAFVLFWGLGIGVVYPLTNALTAVMIPGGRETSYFGIKVLFAKLLVWLPPLAFTAINEATDSLRFAITPIVPFFLIASLITWRIDMDKAHREVADTLHLRRGQFKAQAAAAASKPGHDADLELASRQASAKVAVALAPRPDQDA